MCEHEWQKTDEYTDVYWDGYGADATFVEERVIEYTCKKCGEIKEDEA